MSEAAGSPIVLATAAGQLRGRAHGGVARFLGIPYAAAPARAGRLAPPAPAERWSGVREATGYGPTAPKPPYYPPFDDLLPEPTIAGEEYLNLNVWAPAPLGERLPVMVYVHGGNFMNGSGAVPTYDGAGFARRGVVLVTLNYRLGAQGFLYFDDGVANLGLLDQLAALEWVRENVASFGGDPGNVTLFGQSAGAHSVAMLMTMPRGRGLFRRVIAQSGSGKANEPAASGRLARRVCEVLGVPLAREEIAAVPATRLIEAQLKVAGEIRQAPFEQRREWGELAFSNIPLNPTVDGDTLPLPSLEAAAAGAGAEVDLLTGTNTDELRLGMVPTGLAAAVDEEVLHAEADLYGLGASAVERYRRNRQGASAGDVLAAIRTDRLYRMPSIRMAENREARGARTWRYEFAWASPVRGGELGACHLLDVPFAFDTLAGGEMGGLLGPRPPAALADRMHSAWVRFATDGDPGWPEYTSREREVMRFDTESTPAPEARPDERDLWYSGPAAPDATPGAPLPWHR